MSLLWIGVDSRRTFVVSLPSSIPEVFTTSNLYMSCVQPSLLYDADTTV